MILTSTLRKLIEQDRPVYVVTVPAINDSLRIDNINHMPTFHEAFTSKSAASTYAEYWDVMNRSIDAECDYPVVVKFSARDYVNQYPQDTILGSKLKAGE